MLKSINLKKISTFAFLAMLTAGTLVLRPAKANDAVTVSGSDANVFDWSEALSADPTGWQRSGDEGDRNDLYRVYYHQPSGKYVKVSVSQKWRWHGGGDSDTYGYSPKIVGSSSQGMGGFTNEDMFLFSLKPDRDRRANTFTVEFFNDAALTQKATVNNLNFTLTDLDAQNSTRGREKITVSAQDSSGSNVPVEFYKPTGSVIEDSWIDSASGTVLGKNTGLTGYEGVTDETANIAPVLVGDTHKLQIEYSLAPGSSNASNWMMQYNRQMNISDLAWNGETVNVTPNEEVDITEVIPPVTPSVNNGEVSLELVLSVDVSGSVSSSEFDTQVQGYVSAFNDTEVQNAIKALPKGMAVTMEFWASGNISNVADIGWYKLINDGNGAINGLSEFVAAMNGVSRNGSTVTINGVATTTNGGTDIKLAIDHAVSSLRDNDFTGDRLVIDVSGDGIPDDTPYNGATKTFEYGYKTNQCGYTLNCPPVEEARDAAIAQGITINGLPINNDSAGSKTITDDDGNTVTVSKYADQIDDYYSSQVVGGTNHFSVLAAGFDDFDRAVKLKVLNETLPSPTCLTNNTCESANTPPVANNDPDANLATAARNNYRLAPGQTKTLNVVVENDTDADNDTLSISQFNIDSNSGSLSILNGNQLSYTAPSNIGTYTFMYEVYDGKGGVDKAEVEVEVQGYAD